LFILAVIVVPIVLIAFATHNRTSLSQNDELQHIDYLDRVEHLEIPRFGDKLGQLAMREAACRGIDWPGPLPPCSSSTFDPTDFSAKGYQYQAHQPPLYYAITAPVAKLIESLFGTDWLTSARLVGVLWLTTALAALWLAMTEAGAPPVIRASVCLLLAASPSTVLLTSIVTNDAPTLLVGSLLALLCVRATKWSVLSASRVLGCAALGLFAVWTKPMNGFAVVPAVVFLCVLIWQRRNSGNRRALWMLWLPGVLCGTFLVGLVSWTIFYRVTAYENYDTIYNIVVGFLKVDHFQLADATSGLPQFFTATTDVPFGTSSSIAPWALLARYLLLSFGFGFLWRRSEAVSILGSIALAGLVLGGPALAVVSYFQFHIANHLPARYALGVFALLGVSASALPPSRVTSVVLSSCAVALTIGTLSYLV
jgi:hypothetical protein